MWGLYIATMLALCTAGLLLWRVAKIASNAADRAEQELCALIIRHAIRRICTDWERKGATIRKGRKCEIRF